MQSIDKILCLDKITTSLTIYLPNGKFWKRSIINESEHLQSAQILSVAWSNSEKRIGACLQDKSISFWDYKESFDYEHLFYKNDKVVYNNIWFVEYCKTWITSDLKNFLYKWDMNKGIPIKFPKVHEQLITCLREISSISSIAVSSLDKKIVLWNLLDCCVITIFNMT